MSQEDNNKEKPECFGILDIVFPKSLGDVRAVALECWPCVHRVECLKVAVNQGSGRQRMSNEIAERVEKAQGGMKGFLMRWSRLKSQHRQE